MALASHLYHILVNKPFKFFGGKINVSWRLKEIHLTVIVTMSNFTTAYLLMRQTKTNSELEKFSLSPLFYQLIGCSVLFKTLLSWQKTVACSDYRFSISLTSVSQDFPPVFHLKGQYSVKQEHPQCFPFSPSITTSIASLYTLPKWGKRWDIHGQTLPQETKSDFLRKPHLYFPFMCAP